MLLIFAAAHVARPFLHGPECPEIRGFDGFFDVFAWLVCVPALVAPADLGIGFAKRSA
jgi:hypothetical protein